MPLSSSISKRRNLSEGDPELLDAAGVTEDSLTRIAHAAGFAEAGMVGLPHAETERDAARFAAFIEQGRAGSMAYLARRSGEDGGGELLRSRVQIPFPWARSVVVCLASYHAEAPLSMDAAGSGAGWIARYAWSGRKEQGRKEQGRKDQNGSVRPSDYHKVLLKRLRGLEAAMHAAYGEFECRAYVDTGPVVERSIARAAGLGWTGKNTCLIHPKLGSWNFLGVLVTSLAVGEETERLAVPDRCGSCRRCLDACPTGALVEPYQMDATRCISYLTIEHRGAIGEELMGGMGRQVFGCDICQDVCPWNRKAPIGVDEDSDLGPRRELINPELDWLAGLKEADFERLFNGSPVRRAGFAGLRRNVAIAMGNSGLSRYVPWLRGWASGVDLPGDAGAGEEAMRTAARWALSQIAEKGEPSNRRE